MGHVKEIAKNVVGNGRVHGQPVSVVSISSHQGLSYYLLCKEQLTLPESYRLAPRSAIWFDPGLIPTICGRLLTNHQWPRTNSSQIR